MPAESLMERCVTGKEERPAALPEAATQIGPGAMLEDAPPLLTNADAEDEVEVELDDVDAAPGVDTSRGVYIRPIRERRICSRQIWIYERVWDT